MDGCGCDCGVSYANTKVRREGGGAAIIRDGPTPILTDSGYSVWRERESWSCNLNEKLPTGEPDAGKPPVRFGRRGEVQSFAPTPIQASRLQFVAAGMVTVL